MYSILPRDMKEIYTPEYVYQEHRNWFANPDLALFERLLSDIRKYGKQEPSIIDIGCGNGNFLKYLQQKGYRDLTGLDVMPNSSEGIDFVASRIEDFRPSRVYDVVVSMANIEHIEDVNGYVAALKSFVHENGIILIYTDDEGSLIHWLARLAYGIGIRFPAERLYSAHHINHFSKKSLLRLLEGQGLGILSHWKKNIPLNATDISQTGLAGATLRALIALINLIATIMRRQIMQTAVTRPRAS